MTVQRISQKQLRQLAEKLSDRDLEILHQIDDHHFLSTRQIAAFCFTDKTTETAALRATNRTLAKLSGLRLLVPLTRRIGGARAGSGSYVWTLRGPGARLRATQQRGDHATSRRREVEPSRAFLEHTLAVAEVHLRLRDLTWCTPTRLLSVQLEPACWRPYLAVGGGPIRLKPDLAIITETGDYEDHWFVEIDMNTEPPSRLIRKCQQYQDYQYTGIEQRRAGIFPAVLWIVPDLTRRDTLRNRLATDASITPGLFTIITLDALADLITSGPESVNTQDLNPGGSKGGH